MNSLYCNALSMILVFSVLAVPSPALSADRGGLTHRDSNLSNGDYLVTEMIEGAKVTGCAAVNKNTKPHVFLTILTSGEGGISLVASYYKVDKTKKIDEIDVDFGKIKTMKIITMDGNVMTFVLSKKDIQNADHNDISINNVKINRDVYKELRSLVSKCIAASSP